jgi:hypothetical protein
MKRKLILCGFEPCVLLNFKASAAETGIFHGLKIAFLESTVNKLSTNDLLVYQETVHEDIQSRLFQVHNRKDVKVNIMRFRTLRSIEFQGLCSRIWNLSRPENCIFGRNLRTISFLVMTYSCIKRQSMKIYKEGYSRCIIERCES